MALNTQFVKKRKLGPSSIVPVENPDKDFHESWKPRRNAVRHPMNIPHPSRWVLFGPPGTGKTTLVLNGLVRQDPPFERVFVIHVDGNYSKEYDSVKNFTKLTEIPSPEWWSGEEKTLVILDDLEYKYMSKVQKGYLDRLFGYVSTHKNMTVYLTAQEGFNIPPCVRRCADVWILWKGRDMDAMQQLARKGGLKKTDLDAIYHCYEFGLRDSLWLDTTPHSPYPIRINGTQLVSEDDLEHCRETYAAYLREKKRSRDSKFKLPPQNKQEEEEVIGSSSDEL